MVGSLLRLAAAVTLSFALADCASTDTGSFSGQGDISQSSIREARVEIPPVPLQCVAYARVRSGLVIYGDAGTWWAKAEGVYVRGSVPLPGSVMVLTGYAGPGRAHVAVVASRMSNREITVDHANWLDDGAIYRDDPVVDVSPENNWSEVRIFNPRTSSWGTRTYLVQGFIGPGPDRGNSRIAQSW
jgi:hypothetical protein